MEQAFAERQSRTQQDVTVQAPLMGFINDDNAVLPQKKILLHLTKQDPICHKLQGAVLSNLPIMTHLHQQC